MTEQHRNASPDDAARFLALLARPGDVFELRALSKRGGKQLITAGYFDDMALLARAAVNRSGQDDGVYITLNPVHRGLLSRLPANRVHQVGNGESTSDRDVTARRHLLIDIDPQRPAGISSSDEEHTAALELVRQVAIDLTALGWSEPLLADSGNGGHLVYAVDLPRDDGKLVERVLAQLSRKYTTPQLKVDEKVFNPARISKIYGTLTRKGQSTPDRPHRISRILTAPTELVAVTREQLEAYAPLAAGQQNAARSPAATVGSPPNRTLGPSGQRFDIEAFIAENLPGAEAQPWSGGEHGQRKWLLSPCPFNSTHDRGEAYIVEMNSGAISAGCKHDSCVWTWRELRERFEPGVYERRAAAVSHASSNGRRLSDREPPPEVLYEDADFAAREAAELAAVASRDDQPDERSAAQASTSTAPQAPRRVWWRGPELVDEILRYATEPWVSFQLGGEELVRVRAGGIAVIMGGSGSRKSSLTAALLVEHAKHVGPAIALSIELPAEEFGGRIVGMRCDASWEEALRGQVRREFMEDALDLPRLYVIDQENATLANLDKAIEQARIDYPGEPILTAIDYAQLIESKEREVRMQVADAFKQINRITRGRRVVAIAVSQMSRAAAQQAREGEKIGAASADGGAESAAIERFATVTLSIGAMSEPRSDGSQAVELSLGKARMLGGDRVFMMDSWGRTGRWRIAEPPKPAAEVREGRDAERAQKYQGTLENALLGAAMRSPTPLLREDLAEMIQGRSKTKRSAIACLIARGDLVEVQQKKLRSRSWLVWTPERATETGVRLVRDMDEENS